MCQSSEERRRLLDEALKDAKKWCVGPEKRVDNRHRSDQFWLRHFSLETVEWRNVGDFFIGFRLARQGKWNYPEVAKLIEQFRQQGESDIEKAVRGLAQELGKLVKRSDNNPQHTSAASKLCFFMRPYDDVYIWDQFASRSARYRDWRRGGEGVRFRRLNRLYALVSGEHDYSSYRSSCAKALEEESRREDFAETIKKFREFLQGVGGAMAEPSIMKSSFIERRFLDKLMFCEGKWVKESG